MNLKQQMNGIYQELSLEEIPWNLESPPELLVEVVESRWVLPCAAVDLGCGAGNHAVWLATKGFQMTGVHVFPRERERYAANVHGMLRSGAHYLSVCFSEDDAHGFGGEGKYRKTRLGTTLYFSSEKELRNLFEPLFTIQELCTVEIAGKFGPHVAVKALMTKKDPRDA
jgi:hypothetical protein